MAKKKTSAKKGIFARLEVLYKAMGDAYSSCAHAAGLTCENCQENCCYTYFQHHTHVEWAYLWKGMLQLPEAQRQRYLDRARDNVMNCNSIRAAGGVPREMCPLNDDGLCALYGNRLMICRLHGTRNVLHLPDGRAQTFRGCYRFDELTKQMPEENIPSVDRTPLYRELVQLEMEYLTEQLGPKARTAPRINMTLSEMLMAGPPKLR
ncbi:MAG: hypothetical protein R3Y11_03535 [Pseudomonadota bacterium]